MHLLHFNYGLRPLLDCQSGQQNEKPRQKEEAAEEEVVPTSEDYLKEIRDLLAAQTPPAETVKTDSTFTENKQKVILRG